MDYKINNKTIDKLKYDLVREGILDYNQLIEAIDQARDQQTNLGQILVQNGTIKEEFLLNFLEKKLHIPYVNLDNYTVDTQAAGLITEEEAKKYKLVPLFVIEETLTLAMADPLDLFALNNISISKNYNIEPVICSERSILNTINTIFKGQNIELAKSTKIKPEIKEAPIGHFSWQSEFNEENTSEINMYRLVRAIIYQAIKEKASEIHFDPQNDELIIRFRIDGIMYNRGSLPILLASSCISRIKSASGIDEKECTIPQHGRMDVDIEKGITNTRVSTYPTNLGERLIIKIYTKSSKLDLLGLEEDQLENILKALNQRYGMIIASGPLGNGQTSTIYSALDHINTEHKNIMTIESPIRYNIDRINQSQINIHQKFDFETAFKSILHQEPDVIYIDELYTPENIDLAVRYSLSGKLIITSIIADSTTGVLYRLLSLGIDAKLISESINAIFDQKLIRMLCPKCKTEIKLDEATLKKFNLPDNNNYYTSKGCSSCNNTGFKGRIGIYEVLTLDKSIKKEFNKGLKEVELKNYLKQQNQKTIVDCALNKVKNGLTSIEEVKKVIKHL